MLMISNTHLQSCLFPELIFTIQLPTLDIQQSSQTLGTSETKLSMFIPSSALPILLFPHFGGGPQHLSLGYSGCVFEGERGWQTLSCSIPFSLIPHPIYPHTMWLRSSKYIPESDHPITTTLAQSVSLVLLFFLTGFPSTLALF